MNTLPTPGGKIVTTDAGRDLILIRTFKAPIEDVWASITEPERTARWFGSWTGDAGPGKTVELQMTMEGEVPPSEVLIDACEPPRRLEVRTKDGSGTWHLEALLTQEGGTTELTFIHHLGEGLDLGDVGPGWEYYLDLLVASHSGGTAPAWDDYHPRQADYYREQAAAGG